MKAMQLKSRFNRQKGASLIEGIAYLVIASLVIGGALALNQNAVSSNSSSQMLRDINAIRSSTQQFFMGQGSYGTTSLNNALIVASKIPSSMSVSGSTISTPMGGTLTVTGNTNNFRIAITNVPADVCSNLITNASTGWTSVQIGSSTPLTTFPVSPATATGASACGGTAPFSITWTSVS